MMTVAAARALKNDDVCFVGHRPAVWPPAISRD
jgi:hypothetical protein